MLAFSIFLLAVYGLANAFTLKIGQFIFGDYEKRKFLGRVPYLGDIFYCPPCLAFWIGIACSLFILSPSAGYVSAAWKAALLDGLAASAFAYVVLVATEKQAREVL